MAPVAATLAASQAPDSLVLAAVGNAGRNRRDLDQRLRALTMPTALGDAGSGGSTGSTSAHVVAATEHDLIRAAMS